MNNPNDNGAASVTMRYSYALALLCALVVFIVYLTTLKSGFVNWDDNTLVYSNLNIRALDIVFLKYAFTNVAIASWYPLTLISFAVDYAIWGLSPFGYHLTNNLLHSINTALVFILVFRLFLCFVGNANLWRGAVACALVTALLFGLHPLRVESVAWVAERKDVLYAFFYLFSLLLYLAYKESAAHEEAAGRVKFFYLLSFALFACSLMSKAMAVSLPLVLVIIDLSVFRTPESGFKLLSFIKDKVPFFILSILFSILTISTHGSSGTLVSLDVHTPFARLLLTFRQYIFYIFKTVLPTELAPFYPLPEVIPVFSVEYLGSFILFAIVTALSIYLIKKRRWPAALWAFYVVTLLPVSGIFSIGAHAAADRYTYLPSLGLLLIPGLVIGVVFMRPGIKNIKVLIAIVSLVVIVSVGALTIKQIGVWKDSVTLWNYETSLYPGNAPVAYVNLGNAYDDLSLKEQAVASYKKALDIDPQSTVAHNNLGLYYQGKKSYGLAIEHFEAALLSARKPLFVERILENLGDVFLASAKGKEAAGSYQKVIKMRGGSLSDANLLNKLGIAQGSFGNLNEARRSFKRALELNPSHQGAKDNLKMLQAL